MTKDINIDKELLKESSEKKIKEYIVKTNRNQVLNSLYMAVLESDKYKEILEENYANNKELLNKFPKEKSIIEDIYNKVVKKELDLNLLINTDNLDTNLKIDYFKNLRKDTYKILMAISGYITEIAYVNEIANEILKRNDFKEKYENLVENIDLNKFYENVYKFLMSDVNKLPQRAMEIISVLPLKISKHKYYDIIKKSIVKSFKNSSQERLDLILDRYKAIFNGTLELDYGQKFDYYFRKTHEFKKFNFKESSIKEVEELYINTSKILFEMNAIVNILRNIGMLINRFVVINMVKKIMSNEINQDEIEIIEKLRKDYSKSMEDIKESFSKGNITLEALINELLSRNTDIDQEIDDILLSTQEILAYLNDNYLEKEELLFEGKIETVDRDYLDESIDNLIEFLNRNILDMNNKQRKVRMRRLLYITEFPFENPDDFFSYLKNSLELNSSKEDIIVSINLVAEVMARYKKGE